MRKRLIIGALLMVGLLSLIVGCSSAGTDKNRQRAVTEREENFALAEALYPAPIPKNFPLRRALIKFTEREDLLDHPWYVYILADTGNVVGYYVAQTLPVNSCDFLSSTERIVSNDQGKVVVTAPSLDGIFYGGGGSAAGCDEWFFFDTATDALIKIRGVKFFTADQPLLLNAEPIQIQAQP